MKVTYILNELLSILNVIQERIYVFLIVNLFLARIKVESNIFFGFSGKQKMPWYGDKDEYIFTILKSKKSSSIILLLEKAF